MNEPERLQQGLVTAFNRHDWHTAIRYAEQLLGLFPEHPATHYFAGIAHLELQQLPKALAHLHVAAQFAPERADVLATYARALAVARLNRESLSIARKAMALSPTDAETLGVLAVVLTMNQSHEDALPLYRHAVSAAPGNAHLRYNFGVSLMFTGDLDSAERELETCLRIDPTYWKAYGTRSELKRQTAERNHVAQLEALLERHRHDPLAAQALGMAMAKEYEDIGQHAESFLHLRQAKRLASLRQPYDFEREQGMFDALMSETLAVAPASAGFDSREPIFVLGMPRSGTTLVDRILSSHPQVRSAGELHHFGTALKRLSGSRTPWPLDADTVSRSKTLEWRKLGSDYLASTRPITGQSPRFVDKQPHNFLYAGYIANALPHAKLICLRRNPMDTCLSNFRQVFGEQSPFHGYADDLLDTGRYYLLFDRLIKHWRERFPGRILEVSYEALVDHQERVTRDMLAFCDLPWDDACLAFERNQAPVTTASAVQVRMPMNRRSVGRWKHHENELQPLRELLERGGIAIED